MNPQTFPVPFPTRSLRDWRTSHHAVQTVSPNQLTLLDLQLKPTTTRLTCAHEPRTFHRFKDAPAEIRLLVWQMALKPRVLAVQVTKTSFASPYDDVLQRCYCPNMAPPSILQVCRESRAEAQKHYILIPREGFNVGSPTDGIRASTCDNPILWDMFSSLLPPSQKKFPRQLYIAPELDTLCIPNLQFFKTFPDTFKSVRKIILREEKVHPSSDVTIPMLADAYFEFFLSVFERCRFNCRQITIYMCGWRCVSAESNYSPGGETGSAGENKELDIKSESGELEIKWEALPGCLVGTVYVKQMLKHDATEL